MSKTDAMNKMMGYKEIRFVQLALAVTAEGDESLYGLTAEGKVYEKRIRSKRGKDGEISRNGKGEIIIQHWWQELPMFTDPSPAFEEPA